MTPHSGTPDTYLFPERTMKRSLTTTTFLPALISAVLLGGCAGPHAIGYALAPLDGPPVKYTTPVQVRTLGDRRPATERFEPDEAREYSFYSRDRIFNEPVAEGITRMLQLELANSGIEVTDEANYFVGEKPYLRIAGDILHFHVTCKELPVDTMQQGVQTLWRREQYAVRVSLRIKMIDTLSRKLVMQRVYTSSDAAAVRSIMIEVQPGNEKNQQPEVRAWQKAGDESAIQLLNEHLKNVLVRVRQDVVKQLTPQQ
jgi:hypothetical protein